jgi:NitT/TauT family transport system ATP-binding protein
VSPAQAFVRGDAITVTYGGSIRALDNISFEIPAGQFVSIVGPSGCGKSTLLRLVAGLVQPTSGQLRVDGLPPALARRSAARLSFVFQDATLLPWRTVKANVRLPLELARSGGGRDGAVVKQVLEMVGLGDFGRRYPSELSGGMRMRASLARALVTEPELLLLDEPFGALDDITRQMLNEELATLWSTRRWTGIFVTHNINEAAFLSERILIMSARPGRIVADVAVPFASPRRADLRATAEFAELTGEVASRLRRASS